MCGAIIIPLKKKKNPRGSTAIFKCLPDFDLHLLKLRMDKTHRDKTPYDSISIKMYTGTFRCMDVNSTSEVNRTTKANTCKRIAE